MALTTMLSAPARLSDAELLAAVPRLAAQEREATVALIAHLAELDVRRLYLAEGYPSLFAYGTQVLHLSEHAAYGRIEAARAARRFPVVLEHLADGSLTLTTVTLLAPHLTVENHRDLLEQARHRSRREVEALVAALRPQPPVPASVRRLPAPRTAPAARPSLAEAARASAPGPAPVLSAAPPPPAEAP
ncbi:MAG TPA: HNH endonuclease, partial [Thermodesulfobacteriota bacterium]